MPGESLGLLWNVEGLRSLLTLSPETTLLDKYDLLFLTETFVYDDTLVRLDRFKVFHGLTVKPEVGRPSEGVAIAVKPHLWTKLVKASSGAVVVEGADRYFICIYSPPSREVGEVLEELASCLLSCRDHSKPKVLAGDFNCDPSRDTPRSRDFMEGLRDLGLVLEGPLTGPTYFGWNGSSTIDLILSDCVAPGVLVREVTINRTPLRKHAKLEFLLAVSRETPPPPPHTRSRKTDPLILSSLLEVVPADSGSVMLYEHLKQAISQASPAADPRRPPHKPWFDRECREQKGRLLASLALLPPAESTRLSSQYKRLLQRKKKDYDAKARVQKVKDSVDRPWILLPPRRRPPLP